MRTACLSTVALALGVVSYLTVSGNLGELYSLLLENSPAIDYTRHLDLGEVERGREAKGEVLVRNKGGRDLIIDRIASSCACGGLEREHDGQFQRLATLKVKPGETAGVVVRVTPKAFPVGKPMTAKIFFRTNDPDHREGCIEAAIQRITGGVSTRPRAVVVGSIPVNGTFTQVIEIQDTAEPPRLIEKVSSTNPELVSVRLIHVAESEKPTKNDINGAVSGHIEVVVRSRKPCIVEEAIQVFSDEGRPPDLVPVRGRIVAPFEMRPPVVVLPRQSTSGLLYHDVSVCTNADGKPSRVVVESVPPDLKAEVLGDNETPDGWPIRVSLNPVKNLSDSGTLERIVRLRATNSENDTALELRVLIPN